MGKLFAGVLCAVLSAVPQEARAGPATRATMDQTFDALLQLQPYLARSTDFANPANRDPIWSALGVLQGVEHAIPRRAYVQDPGLALTATWFSSYVGEARQAYAARDFETARRELRTATTLCFDCHTRLNEQRTFVDVNRQVDALDLAPLEKAGYLAATRQYDRALAIYDSVLARAPSSPADEREAERAVRRALVILVELKSDPQATRAFLDRLSARGDSVPIAAWKADADAWAADPFDPTRATPAQLLRHAQKLMGSRHGKLPAPLTGRDDLRLMRATVELRRALRTARAPALRGELLLLLGDCYSQLGEPGLGALDEFYWQDCIYELPHTRMARRCFQRQFDRTTQRAVGRDALITDYDVRFLSSLRKLAY